MLIAEVSAKYGLSQDTLRYYERIGLIPRVNRNKEHVKCMRGIGLPVETLIEYVELYKQGDDTMDARKNLLVEQRRQLAKTMEEMKRVLDRMDDKIARYALTMAEKIRGG